MIIRILAFIFGVIFLILPYFDIKKGRAYFGIPVGSDRDYYLREKEPTSFWLTIVWEIILGLLVISASIYA